MSRPGELILRYRTWFIQGADGISPTLISPPLPSLLMSCFLLFLLPSSLISDLSDEATPPALSPSLRHTSTHTHSHFHTKQMQPYCCCCYPSICPFVKYLPCRKHMKFGTGSGKSSDPGLWAQQHPPMHCPILWPLRFT